MTGAQSQLVQEVLGQRETLLQACWARQVWARPPHTADGLRLQVLFPGWLNRGAGPDFQGAQILLGSTEHRGDVEIHMDERDWQRHQHAGDPRYGRVVLHVVLARGEPAAAGPGGAPLPVFVATPYLSQQILATVGEPEELLQRYSSLPGRCGLRAAQKEPEALTQVIAHAAEARARAKAQRLEPRWQPGAEEQILYELMLQSLGYRPYAQAFQRLGQRCPFAQVARWLEQPYADARRDVLAHWFGALGLLPPAPHPGLAGRDPAAAEELRSWQSRWSGQDAQTEPLRRGGSRPWNSPERRLVGLFQHLYGLRRGWLKGWLTWLGELDRRRDQPDFRRHARRQLERLFETPAEEPWRQRTAFSSPPMGKSARLIGEDRIAVIVANALVPFFLTYARQRGDVELEKVLYRLFIVFPGEAPNQKTRFMEQRLLPLPPLAHTLRTQQGLLQIHEDFCSRFHEGCQDCRFPDLIGPQGGPGA